MSNSRVFRSTKIHQIVCALLGPNRCKPLDFRKLDTPFPKDASREKSTDGRTGHDHYSLGRLIRYMWKIHTIQLYINATF